MEPKLYLCPTPIGNLEDITLRTIKTLRNADVIYAEDTRNSIKLLKHYKISKPLLSCHDHNEAQRAEEIASKVISGHSCCLYKRRRNAWYIRPGRTAYIRMY